MWLHHNSSLLISMVFVRKITSLYLLYMFKSWKSIILDLHPYSICSNYSILKQCSTCFFQNHFLIQSFILYMRQAQMGSLFTVNYKTAFYSEWNVYKTLFDSAEVKKNMNYLATVTGKIGISLLPNLVITIYFFFLRTRFCDELKDCRRPLKCHFFFTDTTHKRKHSYL